MQKIGLALGGGAARGLVHIGVLKNLEERKVHIEELSGTSMGAIIASGIATGMSSSEMVEIAKKINYLKLLDFGFHVGLKGEKIKALLIDIFGDAKIEDTKIPLKITATNLITKNLEVFDAGSIVDAVRASISIPGIFKPHVIDGKKYVDGGLLCNLPIDLLEHRVRVGVSAILGTGYIVETQKLTRKGKLVDKNLLRLYYERIYRAIMQALCENESVSIHNSKAVNHILYPNFGKLDMIDFHQLDAFIELGYELCKKQLDLINKSCAYPKERVIAS